MADYPPPTDILPEFNPAVFRTNDIPLTIAEAENYFLSFPTAQGTENLADVNVAGKLTSTRDAHNLGFGYQALSSAVEGSAIDNTAFGYQALNALTIGDSNSAFGDLALKNLGTDANNKRNTAVGHQTGLYLTEGQDNTFIGMDCGKGVSGRTGSYFNTGVGSGVLKTMGNGTLRNTAVGMECLNGLTTGNDNTAIGYQAGISITTGTNNTFLGSCNTTVGTISYSTAIGYNASVGASNTIVLGTTSETVRYQKLFPLYSAIPFTATDVGYQYIVALTFATPASGTTLATTATLPIGVWAFNLNQTFSGVFVAGTILLNTGIALLNGIFPIISTSIAGGDTALCSGSAIVSVAAAAAYKLQYSSGTTSTLTRNPTAGVFSITRIA